MTLVTFHTFFWKNKVTQQTFIAAKKSGDRHDRQSEILKYWLSVSCKKMMSHFKLRATLSWTRQNPRFASIFFSLWNTNLSLEPIWIRRWLLFNYSGFPQMSFIPLEFLKLNWKNFLWSCLWKQFERKISLPRLKQD